MAWMDFVGAKAPRVMDRRLNRRALLRQAAALGLAVPASTWLLTACGGDDDEPSGSGSTPAANTPTGGATPGQTQTGTTPATGEQPQDGGTITLLWYGTTPDLDPQSAYSYVASSAFRCTYEMLIQLDGESTFDYIPMLAREWEASDDGLEYTFTIFDNVKFHDGTDCTAEEVVSSLRRFHEMGLGPVNVITRFIESPDDITALDERRVHFRLSSPNNLFLAAMASQYGPMIISPAAVEEHATPDDPFAHEWLVLNMVGTGPYKQKEYLPQERLVLERFDDYHQGWEGAHFDEVVFRIVGESSTRRQLIEEGSADGLVQSLTPADVAAIEQAGRLQVLRYDSTNVQWVVMNAGARLADPRVRQAFSWAYPYDDVREGITEGLIQATGGPITPTTRGYDPNVFIYDTDLDRARQLLEEAGWDFSQPLDYWVYEDQNELAAAQLFQANLRDIGITLNIEQREYGAYEAFLYSETPPEERPHFMGGWGWWPDYNDAWNQLYPLFHTDSFVPNGANVGFYSNAEHDAILDEVAPGVEEDVYNEKMAAAMNILTEQDPPVIYQGAVQWYTVLQPNIRGFVSNPIYLGTYPVYDMYRVG